MWILLGITLKFILLLRFPATKSLAGVTLHRYGQDTLDSFRALERSSVKYNKCLIDLDFLKTWLIESLSLDLTFPIGLTV